MKAILAILLVCVAGSLATEAGPFNNILQQVQGQLQTAVNQILSQLTPFLPQLPSNINIQQLLNGVAGQTLAQIQAQLAQLVGSLINGTDKSTVALKLQLFQNLSQIIGNFSTQLSELIGAIFIQGVPRININNIINTTLQNLKPQLNEVINIAVSTIFSEIMGKRDITDFIINSLGLGNVWTIIQGLGQNVVGQITAIGTQLLFAGQQVWAQVRPILTTLASDLFNHVGNAGDIVAQSVAAITAILAQSGKRGLFDGLLGSAGLASVWSEISNLGSSVVLQFYQVFTQLLTAGQAIYAQVIQILQQLGQDLFTHTGNAGDMVNQALAAINAILSNQGRF